MANERLRVPVLRSTDNMYTQGAMGVVALLADDQAKVGVDLTVNSLTTRAIASPSSGVALSIQSPTVTLESRAGLNLGLQVQIVAEATGHPIVVLSGAGSIIFDVGIDGAVKSAKGLGLWGSTPPTTQPTAAGSVAGATASSGTPANLESTYAGSGANGNAYTVDDIVTALKAYGILTG